MNRFLKSFKYAIQGIASACSGQLNIKIQLSMSLLVLILGFYFSITSVEWCLVLFSIALVLGFELMNTAIENLVNLVTQEWLPLAGKIKDIAAAAVLIASIIAAIVGALIFSPYFFS